MNKRKKLQETSETAIMPRVAGKLSENLKLNLKKIFFVIHV